MLRCGNAADACYRSRFRGELRLPHLGGLGRGAERPLWRCRIVRDGFAAAFLLLRVMRAGSPYLKRILFSTVACDTRCLPRLCKWGGGTRTGEWRCTALYSLYLPGLAVSPFCYTCSSSAGRFCLAGVACVPVFCVFLPCRCPPYLFAMRFLR